METKKIVLIVLVVLLAIVMFQNWDQVATEFLFWEFYLPQIVLIFLSALIGFGAGVLFVRSRRRKKG